MTVRIIRLILLVALAVGFALAASRTLQGDGVLFHRNSLSGARGRAPLLPTPGTGQAVSVEKYPVPFGAIVGDVVDAATGRGVPRAVVSITAARGGAAQRCLADDRGRYYFKGLAGGDYVITAEHQGYLPGAYGRLRPDGDPITLFVMGGQVTGGVRLELWRPGSLSGVVVDENNDPLVRVTARVYRRVVEHGRTKHVSAASAITDDRGMFRVGGLAPGDYVVGVPQTRVGAPRSTFESIASTGSVSAEMMWIYLSSGLGMGSGAAALADNTAVDEAADRIDFTLQTIALPSPRVGRPRAYATLFYPGVVTSTSAGAVPVEAARDFAGVTLQMRPVETGRITGVVVGPEGPVDSLLLRLFPDTESTVEPGFETAVTMTAADGSFSFGDVPLGGYVIEARSALSVQRATDDAHLASVGLAATGAAGLEPSRAALNARQALWGRMTARVAEDAGDPLIVLVAPGETIQGDVRFDGRLDRPDDAMARVRIELEPVDDGAPKPPRGFVEPDGRFAIQGVGPGRYFVRATGGPPGWYVASVISAGRDLAETPLDVGGAAPASIAVRYSNELARVAGVVRDARGRGATEATVVMFPARMTSATRANPLRFRSARAGTDGVYAIEGLPDGMYNIAAIAEADAGNWQEPRRLEEIRSRATTMTIRSRDNRLLDLRFSGRR